MENALYYTLSTIAQTLAGALAVLLAVVLFRLQGIEDLIGGGQALLQNRAVPYEESWPVLRDQGWAALVTFTASKGDSIGSRLGARQIYQAAHNAWRFRTRVMFALYLALGFTVVDIALCFAALPFTPRIACSRWATGVVLLVAVGLGIVCLGLYVRLIRVVLGPRTK